MTTTHKPFRLETVLELAKKDTEKATQEVGRLMNTRELAAQKLAMLSDYRNNYRQQMQVNAEGGIDAARLHNYAAFIDRLGSAVDHQRGTISALEAQLQRSRDNWLEKQRREQSFDILRQRHVEEQRQDQERRAQRENDEHAAKLIRMRAAQAGSN
ncbi:MULTISPECIES: flagellar export protein FliJ [Ralstonia solanacearum species complex]|uniref:Flagellar FliJ protein n=4 Tax=Ralstonia solanacearum species complex TaxID=3116862 RepID=A0A0K1ZQQ5_RALSL|nr:MULTISPECIES: flagellar export protein FliJ [Ralstonia]AKZ28420.1 flagellar export protein FliJ [Ralstonia solanacearum]APC66126.1 flagellar export protein FliJ [Ralstonia solanacearum OE1-1]APF88938.1 flagellar export protein FliJ [Ralstonia solanacearum FJAT-1458]ARS58192.1 flagellar export protein FliJ [Ralstonia solanacearum FJAT-91]ESS49700.1 flagellar protein [Ralstonia solanacearum SD54]